MVAAQLRSGDEGIGDRHLSAMWFPLDTALAKQASGLPSVQRMTAARMHRLRMLNSTQKYGEQYKVRVDLRRRSHSSV